MDLGASLGPYRIDRERGSGGMEKVYAATGPYGVSQSSTSTNSSASGRRV